MDEQHNNLYKELRAIEFKLKDVVLDRNKSVATKLKTRMNQLLSDMQANRNPRGLEQDMKIIENFLSKVRSDGGDPLINFDHVDQLRKEFEKMRMKLRSLDNY